MRSSSEEIRQRRIELATLLKKQGYLSVSELSERLSVSKATVRRDLGELARCNEITRTHGGALSEFDELFTPFYKRNEQNRELKIRIARRAVGEICPGDTLFLDAGSTVFAVAEEIAALNGARLTVVTNSLPIAETLAVRGATETHLLGGQLLSHQLVLVGHGTSLSLSAWRFDRAFLGAQTMTAEGLWNSRDEIVDFQRHVCGRSSQAYFCLDGSKLGSSAPSFLISWKDVDRLITTASLRELAGSGIPLEESKLIVA